MERQDTQPFFSDDADFSSLLQLHPSLMSESLPLFDDLQLSSDKCNNENDMQVQPQQFLQNQDQQQLLLQQQQQQNHLHLQPHLLLNQSQNEQENIKFPQYMPIAVMKQEKIEGVGTSLFSTDSLSSTPPEMLRGVPYSAVHSITSDAVNGCTMLRLQRQIEVFQNLPLSQVAELDCASDNTYNYNMNNNLNTHNSYTAPQTQDNCSELLCPPITIPNNYSAAGSTSNCSSFKFPEPTSSMEPLSPATLEVSNVMEIIALPIDHEKKFAPVDQKFILPSSCNETVGGRDSIDPGLTRAKTIDVTTLNNWPGDYDFQIKVIPNDKHKNKWCYSSKVHRLYCYPMLAAEVQVSVNDWMKASCHNAVVRLVAVYQDAHNRTKPVHRCHNCKKSDKTSLDLMEHMVQVSNSGAVHSTTGSRYTVSVPMERSHLGEDSVTLLIRCTCMSSCVGGPNRRPFALLFSLMMNGEEKGRQMLSTKCCKGPNRDIKKDEIDYDRQLGLAVENTSNTNPPDPGADCSPKKANLAIAGGSGLHVALSSPKYAATKRKSAGKKVLISADLFSSDSEPDRSSCKKTKLINSLGRGTGAIPEGYVNLIIPAEFKDDVLKYAEGLQARKFVKMNKPNVLKGVYLP